MTEIFQKLFLLISALDYLDPQLVMTMTFPLQGQEISCEQYLTVSSPHQTENLILKFSIGDLPLQTGRTHIPFRNIFFTINDIFMQANNIVPGSISNKPE